MTGTTKELKALKGELVPLVKKWNKGLVDAKALHKKLEKDLQIQVEIVELVDEIFYIVESLSELCDARLSPSKGMDPGDLLTRKQHIRDFEKELVVRIRRLRRAGGEKAAAELEAQCRELKPFIERARKLGG